jgi:hypothetical protein
MPAKLTQWDLDNFERLFVAGPETDHFSAHLVRLIRKADFENRERLAEVYPEHVQANDLYDKAPRDSRLWRCSFCERINARHPDHAWPDTCIGCHSKSEPSLPPEEHQSVMDDDDDDLPPPGLGPDGAVPP